MLNHWLWLSTREVSNQMKLTLLEHFGTPESIYFSDREEYALVEGMKRNYFPTLEDKDLGEVDKILGDVERLGIRILTIQDAAYPSRLKNIYDPPILLYYKGMLPVFDEEAAVAVVGTRDATPYGIQATEKLSYGMASQGAMVISGLARGIDSAAHRAALRAGGKTAAVLGCGIDVIYPPENRYLYEDVAASVFPYQRISSGNTACVPSFSGTQPHYQRLECCSAGGGSARKERCVDHGRCGVGSGQRSVCRARSDRCAYELRLQSPYP